MTYSQTMPTGGQAVETLKLIVPAPPKDKAPPVDERKARLKNNCKVAHYNKAVLQTPAHVVVADAEGNEVLLDGKQKQTRLTEAKHHFEIFCS